MWIKGRTDEKLVNQATLISEQYHKLLWLNTAKAAQTYPAVIFSPKNYDEQFYLFFESLPFSLLVFIQLL